MSLFPKTFRPRPRNTPRSVLHFNFYKSWTPLCVVAWSIGFEKSTATVVYCILLCCRRRWKSRMMRMRTCEACCATTVWITVILWTTRLSSVNIAPWFLLAFVQQHCARNNVWIDWLVSNKSWSWLRIVVYYFINWFMLNKLIFSFYYYVPDTQNVDFYYVLMWSWLHIHI